MNEQDKRKADAHRNQTTISEFAKLETDGMLQEFAGRTHCEKPNQQIKSKDDRKLLCACGGRCEGVCREQHLHRPRFANPKATAKGAIGQTQWAKRCPSAYEE